MPQTQTRTLDEKLAISNRAITLDIWPYKGIDYDALKRQLREDYIEHALDNF